MSTTRLQEVLVCFGKKKQADIATAQAAADMWRFPSDDEWSERQRRRKVIVKQLGRGISETTIPNGEDIDAAMLAKIRTEEEPEVDAFEAQKVIEQLATCDVDDVVPAGDSFRVVLRVLGGTVTHLLKMWLRGGQAGTTYLVTNRIVTVGGRTDDRTISVKVEDR